MKKFLTAYLLLISCSYLTNAQNIQLHYDFGKDRKMFTSTVEMFKPDKFGSTFFFIDLDYSSESRGVDNGVSLVYWEIARSFKWNENQKWEPQVEFNSGLGRFNDFAFPINNAWLAGVQYTWNTADFSKVFTLKANYKYIKGKHDASYQISAVWGLHFFDYKLSFTGFVDLWKEDNVVFDKDGNSYETDYTLISEPQLWYNATENFSFGGELELSNNFGGNKGFMANPTLGVKWNF
jgi:hypothetical protein